jgi:hypothetical protein
MDRVGSGLVRDGIIAVVAADPDNPTAIDVTIVILRLKAARFIRGAGDGYKSYRQELKHVMLEGRDNYPATLVRAFNILQRRQADNVPPVIQDGVAFVTAGNNGRSYPHVRCNNCSYLGHYRNHCPTGAGDADGDAVAVEGEGFVSFCVYVEFVFVWLLV